MSKSHIERRAASLQNLAALAYASARELQDSCHFATAKFMQNRAAALTEASQKLRWKSWTALDFKDEVEPYVPQAHGYAPAFVTPIGRLMSAPQLLKPFEEYIIHLNKSYSALHGEVRSAEWDEYTYFWYRNLGQMRRVHKGTTDSVLAVRTEENDPVWQVLSQPGELRGNSFRVARVPPAPVTPLEDGFIDPDPRDPRDPGWTDEGLLGDPPPANPLRETRRRKFWDLPPARGGGRSSGTYEDAYGRERYSDDGSPVSSSDGKGR